VYVLFYIGFRIEEVWFGDGGHGLGFRHQEITEQNCTEIAEVSGNCPPMGLGFSLRV